MISADARRLGNQTVFKRLGYLVEVLGLDVGEWVEHWRAEISAGERRGTVSWLGS